MKTIKEEYINLKMTKKEADSIVRILSNMIGLLQESVYKNGEQPPELITELIEDLTWGQYAPENEDIIHTLNKSLKEEP